MLYNYMLYNMKLERKKWQHNLDISTYRCGKQDKDSLE